MKKYAFTKQTQGDFQARLKRVDPAFARHGHAAYAKNETPTRPVFWTLAGFGWFYLVISVARNKSYIRDSLAQGSLPSHYHDAIFAALAAILAVSAVILILHIVSFFAKRGPKRSNSRGILIGALAAGALVYTPPSVLQTGFGMLDPNAQSLLLAAHSGVKKSVPGVDWDNIALVSSYGK